MGTYYKNAEHIVNGRVGRKLDTFLYHEAKRELRRGEHLYAVVEIRDAHSGAVRRRRQGVLYFQ